MKKWKYISLKKNKSTYGGPTEVSKVATQPLKIRQVYDTLRQRGGEPQNLEKKIGEEVMIVSYIAEKEGNVEVKRYFRVKEFACKDGTPVVFIDDHLVTILSILRTKIGRPVIINSGYRTPEHNKRVGGAKYSYHMRGMAADIKVEGMKAKELAKKLDEIVPNECGIIVYNNWVHFDVRHSKYRKGV